METQMNHSQALKEATRLLGKSAAVRDLGPKMNTTEAGREAAHAEVKRIRALREAATTPEEKKALRPELDRNMGLMVRYRYTVGTIEGIRGMGISFFSVKGQGDTWEEAFAKVGRIYKIQAAA
jgi:hypothetical protein